MSETLRELRRLSAESWLSVRVSKGHLDALLDLAEASLGEELSAPELRHDWKVKKMAALARLDGTGER